jgi:hypothetical protein
MKNAPATTLTRASRLISTRMATELGALRLRRLSNALFALGNSEDNAAWPLAAEFLDARIAQEQEGPAILDLVQSLAALADGIPNELRSAAVSELVRRAIAAPDAATVRFLATAVGDLGETFDTSSTAWARSIVQRLSQPTDDEMRLALGELLGRLPKGSVDEVTLAKAGAWMNQLDSDCLAASLPGTVPPLAKALLNPMCSERSWTFLGTAANEHRPTDDAKSGTRDEATERLEKEDGEDDEDFADFHQLILQDDDGLVTRDPEDESDSPDLAGLSDLVKPYRTSDPFDFPRLMTWLGAALAVLGTFLQIRRQFSRGRS